MICKASLTIAGCEVETAATCELVFDGGDEAKFSEGQIQRVQDVCLAVVGQQNALSRRSSGGKRQSQTASATLRQLAKLYRAANRLPEFNLTDLQNLARRLYKKPLEALSTLEV